MGKWIRVTRKNPCPICERDDWCAIAAEGNAVRCARVESGKPSRGKDGAMAWIHLLTNPLPEAPPPRDRPKPKINWKKRARQMYDRPTAAKARAEIASELGVSENSLVRLGVGEGFDRDGRRFYSFPSRDAEGKWTAIQRRYENGEKKTMYGGTPGLFYVDNDDYYTWVVVVVEGATDTAAALDAGLSVIGRPSNTGGAECIASLIQDHYFKPHVKLVVIGENDRKEDSPCSCGECHLCWPGLYGAKSTAHQLRQCVEGPVHVLMPPSSVKDTREWTQKLGGKHLRNSVFDV